MNKSIVFKVYLVFFLISPIFSIFATYQLWVYYLWMSLFFIVLIISRPKLYIAVLNLILNISCAISAPYIWNNFLHEHQQKRILTFLNPKNPAASPENEYSRPVSGSLPNIFAMYNLLSCG